MEVGSVIPAFAQMADYNNSKYPSAVILDDTATPISGSPLHLSLVANGLYANNSLFFPNSNFIVVQKLVYDDSGRTILSLTEGGDLDIIYLGDEPQAGGTIALACQLASYATNKYVKAFVYNDSGAQISGSPVELTNYGNGLYYNFTALTFPGSSSSLRIQYVVYDDSGYTMISSSQGASAGLVYLSPPPNSDTPFTTGLIGIIDSLLQNPINGIQDVMITNTDRILNCRIVRDDTGLPYDLSDYSDIAFNFLNADGSILTISSTDPGSPVQVPVAQAGQVTCSLTKEQTALLMPMNPAPFSVVVDQPGGQTICNFNYQLEIQAQTNMPF